MMWTLIVVATMLPDWNNETPGGVAMLESNGFKTEQQCIDAGNKVPAPASNSYVKSRSTFTCVQKG